MNAEREYFYELDDKVPVEKLEELQMTLLKMAIPEVELEAIRRGKEQFKNGEYSRYHSFDELVKDLMDEQ